MWGAANTELSQPPAPTDPVRVADHVAEELAAQSAGDIVLYLRLRSFPEWDVPLMPDPAVLSPTDVEEQQARRESALAARAALFDDLSADLQATTTGAGGSVLGGMEKTGWLIVQVPRENAQQLIDHADTLRVDGPSSEGGPTVSLDLGDASGGDYLNNNRFIDASYDGGTANSARHSYGRITIGVLEQDGFESGACAFMNNAGCTSSRVKATFRCDNSPANRCLPGTVDNNVNTDVHGTLVTSMAIANYKDGQGNGKALGDPDWASSTCTSSSNCNGQPCESGLCAHSSTWETQHTGAATEAAAVLFGNVDLSSKSASYADMFDDSVDLGLDITNGSWSVGSDCDIASGSALEDVIEAAYDDGILPVMAAGNNDGDDATSCNLASPADLPKAFAVNAYDAGTSDCQNFPSTRCLLDQDSCPGGVGCSSRGGMDADVAGVGVVSDAVSGVNLVAPNYITSGTSSTTGSYGVQSGIAFVGTSAASPFVAGVAALVKDEYLTNGQSWVNSPGRLYTLMLMMSDRHFSDDPSSSTTWTHQLEATPSKYYGLGRAKVRLFENSEGLGVWGNDFSTVSLSANQSLTYTAWNSVSLPSGISLVKCVLHQQEDMSAKSDVSRLTLTVRLRSPSGGACTGTTSVTRTSSSYDLKKIAAIEGTSFTGKCVQVEVSSGGVTSDGAHAFVQCTYSGIDDDVAQ